MYKLKYHNITRETQNEVVKDLLIENGYELISDDSCEKELSLQEKLNAMKLEELKALADTNGIEYDKSIKKASLVELILNADVALD